MCPVPSDNQNNILRFNFKLFCLSEESSNNCVELDTTFSQSVLPAFYFSHSSPSQSSFQLCIYNESINTLSLLWRNLKTPPYCRTNIHIIFLLHYLPLLLVSIYFLEVTEELLWDFYQRGRPPLNVENGSPFFWQQNIFRSGPDGSLTGKHFSFLEYSSNIIIIFASS